MTDQQQPDQQLAKAIAKTPEIITTPDEFRGSVARWQQLGYTLLTPFTAISGIATAHGIFSTVIQIDPNPDSKEVYGNVPWLKGGELALAKNGLRRLAEGLGISTSLVYTVEPGRIQNYWNIKAIATYTGIDGREVKREGGCEWDLRDGSPRLNGFTDKQINEARKHGQRHCETRAINAAIRECGCGVKQAYQKAELQKPFVAIRVSLQPDMKDPDVKRMMTEHFINSTRQLYPAAHATPVVGDPWADDETPEMRHVGRGTTTTAQSGQAGQGAPATNGGTNGQETTAKASTADRPPYDGAVRVEDVRKSTGDTNGRKWTKFEIFDSNGESATTFSASDAAAAEKFKASREWVEVVVEVKGQYRNLVEIVKATTETDQALPGMGNL